MAGMVGPYLSAVQVREYCDIAHRADAKSLIVMLGDSLARRTRTINMAYHPLRLTRNNSKISSSRKMKLAARIK
jgi:hypothetical protein